jgi:transcriptional regulator with XRE-family HTH domain
MNYSTPRYLLNLKTLRERAGLSQQQLAERAGVWRETVSTVENLVYPARLRTRVALAEALGVAPHELEGEAESFGPAAGPVYGPAAETSLLERHSECIALAVLEAARRGGSEAELVESARGRLERAVDEIITEKVGMIGS